MREHVYGAGRYPWEIAGRYAWVTISMADYFEMRAKFEGVQGFAPEPGAEAFNFKLGGSIITPTASGGLVMDVDAVKDGNGNVNIWGRGITPIPRTKIKAGDIN